MESALLKNKSAVKTAYGHKVTSRDIEVIGFICRHGVVTTEHLVEAGYFPTTWAAYSRIRALESLRLIKRNHTFWKAPQVLRVTARGAHLSGVDVRPADLVLPEINHSLAVVGLALALLQRYEGATWQTERELRRDSMRNQRSGSEVASGKRMPDGVLVKNDKRVAIELDLSSKSTFRLRQIVSAYIASDYVHVIWYVKSGMVPRVQATVAAGDAQDLITVRRWL